MTTTHTPGAIRLPYRFIEDCLESCCDVGEYANGRLTATPAQLAELKNRAAFYADAHGPDAGPPGLKTAARAVLAAIGKAEGQS